MEDIKHDPAGLRLIEAILNENSWSPLVDNDFSEKDFFGNSLKALSFIREYYSQYSAFPDSDAVLDEIPNVVFKGNVNTDFAVKTFAKHKLARTLSQIQARSQQFIVNNNPEAAYSFLLEELTQIKPHNTTKSFKQAADARHLEYKKKKLTGFRGVVPPWPTLQKAITVWENGTFNVILGVYSTGKSWCSAVAAHHAAFMQQKKVLLVTMENSKSSMESRLDALYHHIPFTDLRQGWIDMRVEKKWLKDIEKLKAEQGDIIVVDGNIARTVGDILQLVNTHEPDFVIVDGAYKLESKGRDMFERSSNLLHSLHHSAEATRVPWLATSQLNPAADKTKHGKDTASEARGNKDWAINPATVMTLTQSNDQRLLNFVECRIAKVREMGASEGLEMMFLMRQDRQKMLFDEAIDEFVNTEILESLL